MAKVELKQPIIDEIKGLLDNAVSVTVVDYRGLTVAQDTELRKQLREAGVAYKVFKNTLVKRAAEGSDYAQLDGILEGPNAIAVCKDDATAAARIIAKFAKTAPALELRGAVVEGVYYDEKAVQALSEIPSREELLGRLLGSMQSPITNLARVLNQIAEKSGDAA
ncbi:50S ribosomal protein L10 [Oribacterium sp. oral taxon 102]|uniref:50S ribosomal protein L10 n=1 Tax=Oribacterium sp. oral taxon 102 TaxID=671214 RepID=UPI0015B83B77|nr:50S ribosomal protein L10 [Oribacterium sp. oral taxon 102]NWO22207.1 50S ribosomal protein L10 [Oribacterium sp. oral taxon 102]